MEAQLMHRYNDLESMIRVEHVPYRMADIEASAEAIVAGMEARYVELAQIELPMMITSYRKGYEEQHQELIAPFQNNPQFDECIRKHVENTLNIELDDITRMAELSGITDLPDLSGTRVVTDFRRWILLRCFDSDNRITLTEFKNDSRQYLQAVFEMTPTGFRHPYKMKQLIPLERDSKLSDLELGFLFQGAFLNETVPFNTRELGVITDLVPSAESSSPYGLLLKMRDGYKLSACARALLINPSHEDRAQIDKFFAKMESDGHIPGNTLLHKILDCPSVNDLTHEQYICNARQFYSKDPIQLQSSLAEFDYVKGKILNRMLMHRLPRRDDDVLDIVYMTHLKQFRDDIPEDNAAREVIFGRHLQRRIRESTPQIEEYQASVALSEAIDDMLTNNSLADVTQDATNDGDNLYQTPVSNSL
ncbi:hypothetical protein GCM10011607_28990 [Shewanella inventionis]|uniref:Uncharacterized protein n=1 Tax=Shewanella inventionis TaxID=1738770 RepID=A0ABQ1JEJ4_9GAMM|nr:hypothetical protein [Shewanella inventionis]GGB66561.1 hypothetical protein GCM10011607_28990 [Shewanella inventionis]